MNLEHKRDIAMAFGIILVVVSLAAFVYTLVANVDARIYPIIPAFAAIGALMILRIAHPPVHLVETESQSRP